MYRSLLFLSILAINFSYINSKPTTSVDIYAISQKLRSSAIENTLTSNIPCDACAFFVSQIRDFIQKNQTTEFIIDFATGVCKALKIVQDFSCETIIRVEGPEVLFVVEQSVLQPHEICGLFLKNCGSFENPMNQTWGVKIPDRKPAPKPWPVMDNPLKTLRVLHLSDIHIDRWYEAGTEADCNVGYMAQDFMCCRNYTDNSDGDLHGGSFRKDAIRQPAGYWGAQNSTCDIPYRLFDHAMNHIAKTHTDLDYIIITGDMGNHAGGDYSKEEHISNINNITQTLLKYFPKLLIIQAVGNHEGVPMDAFAPHTMPDYDERGPQWLYNLLWDDWSHWLPYTTEEGIQYRGSYSFRPFSGLKYISLNTIYCSHMNFYLYINATDPDYTLKWLIGELLDSEMRGEKVHIIGHIPSGSSYCLEPWTQNYYKIVERFENTIAAQFFGHDHDDHFQVFFEDEDPTKRPIHVNFIAPSLTTYTFELPAYRIYTIDGNYPDSSFTVLEAETYWVNLTDANLPGNEPVYQLEYTFKQDYNMPDLSPQSFADLINRMKTDQPLFDKYYTYITRMNDPSTCDAGCRRSTLCGCRIAEVGKDDQLCAGL